MRFSIPRDALFDALQKVQNVVEKKHRSDSFQCFADRWERSSYCFSNRSRSGVNVTLPLSSSKDYAGQDGQRQEPLRYR